MNQDAERQVELLTVYSADVEGRGGMFVEEEKKRAGRCVEERKGQEAYLYHQTYAHSAFSLIFF